MAAPPPGPAIPDQHETSVFVVADDATAALTTLADEYDDAGGGHEDDEDHDPEHDDGDPEDYDPDDPDALPPIQPLNGEWKRAAPVYTTLEQKAVISRMLSEGCKAKEISQAVGVEEHKIYIYQRRYKATGEAFPIGTRSQYNSTKMHPMMEKSVRNLLREYPGRLTYLEIRWFLILRHGVVMSQSAICKHIKDRRPQEDADLTPAPEAAACDDGEGSALIKKKFHFHAPGAPDVVRPLPRWRKCRRRKMAAGKAEKAIAAAQKREIFNRPAFNLIELPD